MKHCFLSKLSIVCVQTGKSGRTMPNILDDIIASVVENKIPASRGPKLSLKSEPLEETRPERKKAVEEPPKHPDIPHCWLYDRKLLWLKDHRNNNNWKLFRECWSKGQVSHTANNQTQL